MYYFNCGVTVLGTARAAALVGTVRSTDSALVLKARVDGTGCEPAKLATGGADW